MWFFKPLIALFLLIPSMSFAATYYVSSSLGNDSNSGLSESSAWRTLNRVNSITYSAGDRILFKAGDVWQGQFTPHGSGIPGNNIIFSSYGTGAKPEIRAYGEVPGWTNSGNWSLYSAGIYRIYVPVGYFNRLWINGIEKRHGATLALTDDYPWAFNSSYLYVKAPSNPATYFLSVAMPNLSHYAAVIQSVSNIEMNGLRLTGGYTTIEMVDSNNITIDNCEIGFRTELYGLNVNSSNGTPVTNTIVRNSKFITGDSLNYNYDRGYVNRLSTEDAIHLGANNTNAKIYSNYFENWSHTAIYLTGGYLAGNEVYGNFITAPGIDYARGMGADYTSGSGNSFHHNTIYNTSVRNQFNGPGLKVHNNIIDGVRGVPVRPNTGQGLSIEAYATPATNMEIYNNTIRNTAYEGIKVWGTNAYEKSYNNIHDNNVINTGASSNHIQLSVWAPDLSTVHHNTFTNNHFYSSSSVNTVEYEYLKRTVASFNASTLNNGDVRSGNDAVIKYVTPTGIITVNDPSRLRIEHNASDVAKTIPLATPMIDSKGIKYSGSVTLQPYSSIILIEDSSTPTPVPTPVPTAPTSGTGTCVSVGENGTANISCPSGQVVTAINFASFGTATGQCGSYTTSSCHAANSKSVVSSACLGKTGCSVLASVTVFGDPCPNTLKDMKIDYACSSPISASFSFTGPTSGNVNSASASFTVTPSSAYTGTITITPSGTASAGLSPKVLTFSNSSTPQSFTITPTVAGSLTLTATNSGALTNPASRTYTVNAVVPGAPTSVVATAGNASASVSFAAPVDKGGTAITGYTVTSIPAGGIDTNAGSTSLTHTMTGLTNGTAYTFTVKATNSAGTSAASAASNSVIPTSNKRKHRLSR